MVNEHVQYLFTFSSSSFYHFSKSLETRLSNQWEINKLGMMGEEVQIHCMH